MKAYRNWSCDCGDKLGKYSNHDDIIICKHCGEIMYQDFSYKRIAIPKSIFMYNESLGGEIRTTQDYIKAMDKQGRSEITTDQVVKLQNKQQREARERSVVKIKESVTKTMAKVTSGIAGQISAEMKNTGQSATAKKIISEV